MKSAPSLTLARVLHGLGLPTAFVSVRDLRRLDWVRSLASVQAIVVVAYWAIDVYELSQLATAAALGVPIIRWWVGSDVLNALTDDNTRKSALQLDRIVSANVAVAPHLVAELSTAGIHARFVPSILDPVAVDAQPVPWREGIKPILVYLPTTRKDFYGMQTVEPAIKSNPDLQFIVIADESHSLAGYRNVESVGWIDDMTTVYPRAGCVLRITAHDGLPRMLMEALLYGLYAIYSWPLTGCWLARTQPEISAALSKYRGTTAPNFAGRTAVLDMLAEHPDRMMSDIITGTVASLMTRRRGIGLAIRSKLAGDLSRV